MSQPLLPSEDSFPSLSESLTTPTKNRARRRNRTRKTSPNTSSTSESPVVSPSKVAFQDIESSASSDSMIQGAKMIPDINVEWSDDEDEMINIKPAVPAKLGRIAPQTPVGLSPTPSTPSLSGMKPRIIPAGLNLEDLDEILIPDDQIPLEGNQEHSKTISLGKWFFNMLRVIWYPFLMVIPFMWRLISSMVYFPSFSFVYSLLDEHFYDKEAFARKAEKATNFEEWREAALELDAKLGFEEWKQDPKSDDYDWERLEARLAEIRALAKADDIQDVTFHLRSFLLRNINGIGNPMLYNYTTVGTKYLIDDYVTEVVHQLNRIVKDDTANWDIQEKFDFFYETRQAFGRSAVLFSGGATLGLYHLGVAKALFEANLLPRVMSGSSIGSLICAIVGTRTDEELPEIFEPGKLRLQAFDGNDAGAVHRKIRRLLTKGVLMDIRKLQQVVRANLGDVTFQEAYNRTGRMMSITVNSTHDGEFPRLLNYLTAPNVLVWSAACASCALPGLYESVELLAKTKTGHIVPWMASGLKWSDGSVNNDLPMARLSELFNVNMFIVSQVNPHVAPMIKYSIDHQRNPGLLPSLLHFAKTELKHRVQQLAELRLLPSFLMQVEPVLTQKYEGDITIVPTLKLEDYKLIVTNPTDEKVQRCIHGGQLSTFPKISYIRNYTLIERTLENCVQEMRYNMGQSGGMVRSRSDRNMREVFSFDELQEANGQGI